MGLINRLPMKGHVIELNKASTSDTTYLSEGVETGLSLLEYNKDANIKALLSKSNFLNVDLNKIRNNVVLCLDNDGEKTFNDAIIIKSILRLQDAGKTITIIMPNKEGMDFNDVLKREGVDGVKRHMTNNIDLKSAFKLHEDSNKDLYKNGSQEELIHAKNTVLKSLLIDNLLRHKTPEISGLQTSMPSDISDSFAKNDIIIRQKQSLIMNHKVLELER